MDANKPYSIIRQAIRIADIDRQPTQSGVTKKPIFRSNEEIEHLALAVLDALRKNGLQIVENGGA